MKSQSSHGKTFILATAGVAVLAWAGITFLPTDRADAKEHSSGTLACGGYYQTDTSVSGSPEYHAQRVRWIFHNLNENHPIVIDALRVYDWDGTKVWDSNDANFGGFLPNDLNGLIGSQLGNNVLGPFQTAWYKSEQLVNAGLLPPHDKHTAPNPNQSHVKVHVDWHADTNVNPLVGAQVRVSLLPGGTSWGRSQTECRDI